MLNVTYILRSGRHVIGECVVTGFDDGMSIAMGPFRPAPAYEAVRAVFRTFAELEPGIPAAGSAEHVLLQEFYRRRDDLGLELAESAGRVVPTAWIMVYDFSVEAGEEGYEWDAQISDPKFRPGPQ